MPVSGTFRTYPLSATYWQWEDGPVIWSKGHHDPARFLAAAALAWAEENDESLEVYESGGWIRVEGPVWPPPHLRDPGRVRHEWWANRMHPDVLDAGYAFMVEPGPATRRGAYPVTVIE